MKKIILMIALVTGTCATINAQDNDDKDLREKLLFGIKGGANYSNVYDSQGEEFTSDPKLGFAGGIFLSIPIGKYFGIQPEVLYSQKGFKGRGRILGNNYQFTRTSNYLDVPLLFAAKPGEFLTVLAGPQFSYLISQTDVFENALTTIEQRTEFENESVRKNMLCFLGGIDLTFNHIVIGARAGWDLQSNNKDGSSSTPRYKNVWYQATIGYRFYSKND